MNNADKAIKIDPNDANPWIKDYKGSSLYNLGKDNEAVECYDKAIKIDPNYAVAWHNKGLVLHDLGKQNDAGRCFAKARELGFSAACNT